jgi:hypothetical protein
MKARAKVRWAFAGAIWAATLMLLYQAHRRIDEIGECRLSNERLRSDARFRRIEAERLTRVSQLRDGLVLHVNSAALGLIGLRSELEKMASRAEVHADLLDADTTQRSENNQIPYHIITRGPVKGLLKLLAEIDQRPYLQPRAMELKVPVGAADGLLDERLILNYQVRETLASDEAQKRTQPPGVKAP